MTHEPTMKLQGASGLTRRLFDVVGVKALPIHLADNPEKSSFYLGLAENTV